MCVCVCVCVCVCAHVCACVCACMHDRPSTGASGDVVFTIVLPVLAGTAVVALLIVVIVWRWHKRSVHRKMSRMKSKHDLELLKRRPTTSMLDFSIADQTTLTSVLSDLPPYDPEWNFSSENLSKPVEIGKGAFGVVYRAVATGILSGKETETTEVALKCSKGALTFSAVSYLSLQLRLIAAHFYCTSSSAGSV